MISRDPISGLIFSWSRLDISCCLSLWPGINAIKITGVEINWDCLVWIMRDVCPPPALTTVINPYFTSALVINLCPPPSLARVNIPQSCKEDVFNYYDQPPLPPHGLVSENHSSRECTEQTGNYAKYRWSGPSLQSLIQRTLSKQNELSSIYLY